MKKKLILLTALLAGFVSTGVFTSCKDNDEDLRNEVLALIGNGYNRDSLRADINRLREELYGMVPTVEIRNGYWWINGENTGVRAEAKDGENGKDGVNGENGKDGVTPTITINENGFWVINGETTAVRATGDVVTIIEVDGVKYWAINGENTGVRAEGINGTSADPNDVWTIGEDGYWYKNGQKTEFKAVGENGKDGEAPTITISEDGYWVINGVKTEWKAVGENGKDGETPTISISEDGYWVINGEKTETLAIGQKGEDGEDGKTPTIYIGEDGYWYINDVKTEYKAQGADGQDGADADKWTIGDDGYWYLNGEKTEWKAVGTDGGTGSSSTWTIGNDGYWYLNGEKTEWKAVGTDGADGSDGADGATWSIGEDGYWYKNGEKTEYKAVGTDAVAPQIEIKDGYWWVNGKNTGVKAVGEDGKDGASSVEIKDGYWWINGVNTGVKATGDNGADGTKIEIKKDEDGKNYWYIDGVKTLPVCEGCDVERYNAACDAIEEALRALENENTSWDDVALAGSKIREILLELKEIREIAERAEAKADSALNALRAQITGIVVQGAYNPAFGQLALPTGMNTNVLMAYYGNAAEAVTFPLDAFDNAGDAGYDYSLVSGMPRKKFSGDIVSSAEDNAGKLYLTINPSSTDFTGIQPVLVNSLGEESLVTLSTVVPSTQRLSFGYTRAAGTGFYEATAHISAANASKVAPRIDLNKDEIVAEIKDILTVRDGINWTAIAKTVYNAANDVLDAEGVKVEWEDDLGTHSVTSNYGIAATAMKALSFDFELDFTRKAIDTAFDEVMNFIQEVWDEVADKFVDRYGTTFIELHIESYALSEDGKNVIVTDSNGHSFSVPIARFGSYENVVNYIEEANYYINRINKMYSALIVNDSITSQIQHVLDKLQNRLLGYADNFNAHIQPVLFTSAADGTKACSGSKTNPTELSATSTTLFATTHTADMLAPAYLKYVACTAVYNADGTAPANQKALADAVNKSGDMNTIIDGNVRPVAMAGLQKGYTYELSYATVDYQGKTRCQHYYVRVK